MTDHDAIDAEVLDMIAHGLVTRQQVEKALDKQESPVAIGKLAVELRMLTPHQVLEILRIQRSRGFRFGDLCIRKGWLQSEQVFQLLATQRQRASVTQILVKSGVLSPAQVEKYKER
jgi:hypothetical protein